MRKRTLCAVLILTVLGIGRMDSQEVVSSAGGDAMGTGGIVSWTMGEPISETLGSSTTGYATQGFQQPAVSASAAIEEQIPTISEWGLMICGLMLLTIGVLGVRRMNRKQEAWN